MSANLAGYYALGSNINASATSGWNAGAGFMPVGTFLGTPFSGTLDGLNHTITGLTINRPSTDWVGLFGFASRAAVAHVGLVNLNIIGGQDVGGLAGYNYGGTVINSYSTGVVTSIWGPAGGLVGGNTGTVSNSYSTAAVSGYSNVGGLAGSNHGTVSNSYSTGAVTGSQFVGGLVGANYGGIVNNTYSTGPVTATYTIVGGLVGLMYGGTVSNSYSTGAVSGSGYVGGLVGLIDYQGAGGTPIYSPGTVSNSYSTGAVTGDYEVGGLVGAIYDPLGSVTDSFWDTQTSGTSTSAGGTGLTTKQMKTRVKFSWDFKNVWTMKGHSYPLLRSFLQ